VEGEGLGVQERRKKGKGKGRGEGEGSEPFRAMLNGTSIASRGAGTETGTSTFWSVKTQ
jgi:hypothetical protein